MKRWVFRRLQKTGKDGVDVTRRGRVPGTSSGDRKSSITGGWQPCMADRQKRSK